MIKTTLILPTFLSRFVAYLSVTCIVAIYIITGWLDNIIPAYVPTILGGCAIALLFLAKYAREHYGKKFELTDAVRNQFNSLARLELGAVLATMLSAFVALSLAQLGASKGDERFAFSVSIVVILMNIGVNIFVYIKSKPMLSN